VTIKHSVLPISVIAAPFHAGEMHVRVGRGPGHLLAAGLINCVSAIGRDVDVVAIEPVDAFEGEIGRSFEIKRRVARAVAHARERNRFPIVLAGNCNTSVGVHAGLGKAGVGILWFDAHPDFDTPDDAMSGYFDGMGVATLAGQCWHRLAASIPGYKPIDLRKLIYCGIRDFEPGQREKLEAHGVAAVFGDAARRVDFAGELSPLLHRLPDRTLFHIDLDCLDTSVGQANEYAAPGGLLPDDLARCLTLALERTQPAALTIASFNPDLGDSSRITAAALNAVQLVVQHVD
jgi:arginase